MTRGAPQKSRALSTWVILYLVGMAATAFVFLSLPQIDLAVSRLFVTDGQGFALGRQPPFTWLHDTVPLVLGAAVVTVLTLALLRRLAVAKAVYLLLALALGPGLLANTILKDNWGRARPAQITEFGGTRNFTPPLLMANQCAKNCSFVSGDGAAGFAAIAFALLAARRRALALTAAIGIGLLFGGNRILQGGHFLSDVLFAGWFVGGLSWLLYHLFFGDGWAARWRSWLAGRWSAGQGGSALGRWQVLALAGLPLAAVAVPAADQDIAVWARGFSPEVHEAFKTITQLGVSTGWLVGSALLTLLFAGLARQAAPGETKQRWRDRAVTSGFIFVATGLAGLVNSLPKFLIGRTRPKLFFRDGTYSAEFFRTAADYVSMPSGHTATIFALATALALLLPRFGWPLMAAAALIGSSRFLINAHWLSDVIVGALLGSAVALLVHRFALQRGLDPHRALNGWNSATNRQHSAENSGKSLVPDGGGS